MTPPSLTGSPVRQAPEAPATVVMGYHLLDLSVAGGVVDLTEGIYAEGETRSRRAYLKAQRRQGEYLLDEIRCRRGSRILDIGCGNGPLLRLAQERGARAIGVTISPEQVARCRRQGLEAHLLNYRNLPPLWDGTFDGLVANGSLEHFVSLTDAAAGRSDAIYQEMFATCRRLVGPGCRLATTAIHFRSGEHVRADDLLCGPEAFAKKSPEYHFAMVLERTLGGWYPAPGQLAACAQGYFRLVREMDGTRDYHLTSEYWLRRLRWSLATNPRIWVGLLRKLVRHAGPTLAMLRCLWLDQSWVWQFRGDPPPTMLLRHTWEAV